ncbi:MAG TPA: hypothetical protein VLQ80_01630 [Candidatus Saccharimonadia bacterium]|nr:hypothetical protein [Candidatus Saccharimonadia bacterium]
MSEARLPSSNDLIHYRPMGARNKSACGIPVTQGAMTMHGPWVTCERCKMALLLQEQGERVTA